MRLARILLPMLLGVTPAAALAQAFPTKPLRLIVADGPGSVSDIRARQVAVKLGEFLGQPVVIENRPGASMTLAADMAARSAPDGYTLFLANVVTHSLNPLLMKSLPYKPIEDFKPVTLLSSGPMVLVTHPDVAAKTAKDLIADAKARPGALDYCALGVGSPTHLAMEQLRTLHGANFTLIPYKSSAACVQDLVAGHVKITLGYWAVVGPQVKSAKLRALAVVGPRRLAAAPDVPTLDEVGFGNIESSAWQGIVVPAGTPARIISRLHAETVRALATPEVRDDIVALGSEVGGNTPEEFAAYIRTNRERWQKAVSDAKIEPQ